MHAYRFQMYICRFNDLLLYLHMMLNDAVFGFRGFGPRLTPAKFSSRNSFTIWLT